MLISSRFPALVASSNTSDRLRNLSLFSADLSKVSRRLRPAVYITRCVSCISL
jgi:hypothetical protein